jgi:cell division protein FtsL
MHCQPLLEDQFKPVIAENYYKPRLFWFELDRDQTKKLISLFSSSPVIADTSLAGNTQKWGSLFKASSVQEGGSIEVPALEWNAHTGQASAEWESRHGPDLWGEEALIDEEAAEKDEETGGHDRSYASVMRDVKTCPQKKWSDLCKDSNSSTATRKVEDFKTPALELKLPSTHQSNMKRESSGIAPCLQKDEETGGHDRSYASVMRDVKTSCPQKKWSDLLKDSNSSTATKKVKDFKTPALELKLPSSHQSNMKWESSGVAPCLDGGCDLSDAATDDWGIYNDQLVGLGPNSEVPYSSAAAETSSFPQRTSYEIGPTADKRRELEGFKTAALHSHLAESNIQWNSSCVAPSLDIEIQFSKVSIDEGAAEKGYKQNIRPKPSGKCSSFSSMNREMLSYDTCLPEEPMDLEIESSEVQFFVAEVIDIVHFKFHFHLITFLT